MKISDFPQDIEPRVGDILEIEQGDVCFEVRIIGITADGYLCEQDNVEGAVLLEGVALDQDDVTDITGYITEERVRLDPKCWKGKKIGNPKTKMKGGVRVNNCVPEGQEVEEAGPFRSTEPKKPRKGSVAYWAEKKRKEQEKGKPPIEPKDQMVGVAKVTKGVAETSDYFRRREREEGIISGKRPARKKAPAQTSDYAKRREQEKKAEQGVSEGSDLPPKVIEMIKKIAQSSASPEHKKAAIDALVAKYSKQGVAEGEGKTQKYEMMMRNGQVKKFVAKDDADAKRIAAGHGAKSVIRLKGGVPAGKVSEQGVAEADNTGPHIVYATGPRTQGINDVDLVFKDIRKGKIVARVVGNNRHLQEFAPPSGGNGGDGGDGRDLADRPPTYEIRMGDMKRITYVAFGDPQQDSEHTVYKLGPAKPDTPKYYGQGLTLVSELDWWSFLEKMIGEIMWEDDAIEAGYVDRLDNGDLVFVKNQGVAEGGHDDQFSLSGKMPATDRIPQDSTQHQDRQLAMGDKIKQQTIAYILKLRPEFERSDLELATTPELIQMLRDIQSGKMTEAEYQGRKVALGKPMAGDVKKSKVYVRKPNGKVVKVNFGDKKMKIKKSNPNRRKSFRARHNCENPGPRWRARYWSCRAW